MNVRLRGVALAALAIGCAVAAARAQGSAAAGQQDARKGPIEQFTSVATNIGRSSPVGASQMDIVIERWTSAGEHERFIALLQSKGQQGLLDALQKVDRVGYLRTPGSLAYEMRFAQESRTRDGRRRIIMLTDRPIGFGEAINRPITIDYPFSSVDLRLDDEGNGEGTVSIATKVVLSGDLLILEGYADQPIRLHDIKRRK